MGVLQTIATWTIRLSAVDLFNNIVVTYLFVLTNLFRYNIDMTRLDDCPDVCLEYPILRG